MCRHVYCSPRAMHMDMLHMPTNQFVSAVQCQLPAILLVAVYGYICRHIDLYVIPSLTPEKLSNHYLGVLPSLSNLEFKKEEMNKNKLIPSLLAHVSSDCHTCANRKWFPGISRDVAVSYYEIEDYLPIVFPLSYLKFTKYAVDKESLSSLVHITSLSSVFELMTRKGPQSSQPSDRQSPTISRQCATQMISEIRTTINHIWNLQPNDLYSSSHTSRNSGTVTPFQEILRLLVTAKN